MKTSFSLFLVFSVQLVVRVLLRARAFHPLQSSQNWATRNELQISTYSHCAHTNNGTFAGTRSG